jgi:hypothetical protein
VQPFASVAVTVIGKEPVFVGVPDNRPPGERVKPAGNVPVSLNVMAPTPPV